MLVYRVKIGLFHLCFLCVTIQPQFHSWIIQNLLCKQLFVHCSLLSYKSTKKLIKRLWYLQYTLKFSAPIFLLFVLFIYTQGIMKTSLLLKMVYFAYIV
jgi:hypothetical protein